MATTATPTLRTQARYLAWRSVIRTMRTPIVIVPPLIFPLFLLLLGRVVHNMHQQRAATNNMRFDSRFLAKFRVLPEQPLLEAEGGNDFLFQEGKGIGWRTSSHGG